MKTLEKYPKKQIIVFIVSSLLTGFLLVPIHELGHVICHWISGNPAGMSYARDYMLGDGELTLLGVSGGLVLPVLLAVTFLIIIGFSKKYYELFLPMIILGSLERFIQYVFGITPSDERIVSDFLSINVLFIKLLFCLIFAVINSVLIFILRAPRKTSYNMLK